MTILKNHGRLGLPGKGIKLCVDSQVAKVTRLLFTGILTKQQDMNQFFGYNF